MKHALALSAGLVALSIGVATPAMAQMKTSEQTLPSAAAPEGTEAAAPVVDEALLAPVSPEEVIPAAYKKVVAPATPSVKVTLPATPSAEVVLPATPSATMSVPVVSQPAAPAGGGFSFPKSPFPINVGVTYDGPGSLGTGGFDKLTVSGGGATTQVPALGNASTAASGYGLMAELGLPLVTLGARLQNYGFTADPTATFTDPTLPQGATVTKPTTIAAFFPTSYNEVYANLLGITLGYRNETFAGTGNYAGNYGNVMVGLPLFGINLLDVVGVGVGVKAGYAVSKPEALKTTDIIHVPVDGDAHVSLKLAMVRAKLGYKAAAVVNAAPGDLFSALTNPGSLVPTNGTIDQKKLDNLTATRYGLYTGPYMGIELNF